MHEAEKLSLEGIGRFVEASEELRFEGAHRGQVYGWVERVLIQQEYAQQGKAARGLVRRYIEKMTGRSRAQVTRLIARYAASGRVQPTVYRRRRFPERFTRVSDVKLENTAGRFCGRARPAVRIWQVRSLWIIGYCLS